MASCPRFNWKNNALIWLKITCNYSRKNMIVKFVAENLFITRLWSSICLENIKLIWSIPAFTLEVPPRIQLQKRPNIKKSMFQMKTLLLQQIKNFWSFWTWFNYILLFVSNVVEYHKKFFKHLTTFFMPICLVVCKNLL